ncbi:MAG TPA: hypothetical protein VMT89_15600, partial [Candidatus Acidoferrales bacterium]|nr:hypothetical protein [Candidatus Acidoferrales bacterium]
VRRHVPSVFGHALPPGRSNSQLEPCHRLKPLPLDRLFIHLRNDSLRKMATERLGLDFRPFLAVPL